METALLEKPQIQKVYQESPDYSESKKRKPQYTLGNIMNRPDAQECIFKLMRLSPRKLESLAIQR